MANKKPSTKPSTKPQVEEVVEEIVEQEPIVKGKTLPPLLNIRKQAKADSEIIGIVSADTELVITNKKQKSGFYAVNVNGVDGFAMAEFIQIL